MFRLLIFVHIFVLTSNNRDGMSKSRDKLPIILWMSTTGYEYWEKLLREEALTVLKELENKTNENTDCKPSTANKESTEDKEETAT